MDIPRVLYHYCSTDSFHKIISSRSLRLSALSFSNDYLEGMLVRKIIQSLSIKHNLNDYIIKNIEDMMDLFEKSFDSHGFCLSGNGDLLSQWRAYADDGHGISIGFSSKFLNSLITQQSVTSKRHLKLTEVIYSRKKHEEVVQPIFDQVLKIVSDQDFDDRYFGGLLSIPTEEDLQNKRNNAAKKKLQLLEAMTELLPKMFTLKTIAFSEESEWRVLESSVFREESLGGHFLSRDQLIPFHEIRLDQVEDIEPIVEIYLGPKHRTNHQILKGFLEKFDFKNVTIKKSMASYR